MPTNLPVSPDPDGAYLGGPYYNYATIFGSPHNMWERIELLPKGPHRVLVLRSYRRPAWNNADLSLHLQVKYVDSETLAFRCSIGVTQQDSMFINYLPASCRNNTHSDDWSW